MKKWTLSQEAKENHRQANLNYNKENPRTGEDVVLTLKKKSLTNEKGCFLFQGKTTKNGYGRVQINNVETYIHRFSYSYFKMEIPEGLKVLHTCDIPNCWNPEHLFLGTQKENMHDMLNKGRGFYQNRNNCSKGHEYTLENTYIHKTTKARTCKICRREYDRNRRLKNKTLVL